MSYFVYVVDDEESVRTSLFALLGTRPGLLLQTFASGGKFVAALPEIEPGIVLLDIHMPGLSGLDVLRSLATEKRRFASAIITGQGEIALAVQAMKLGAVDFLEKPHSTEALFAAVDRCAAMLDDALDTATRRANAEARLRDLSDREMDVLTLLLEGRSSRAISEILDLSVRTVDSHRSNLMAKLHVNSLAGALRIAFAAGKGYERS